MSTDRQNNLMARWARAGVGFNTDPAEGPLDLERLLLDTARHGPASARLFTMAGTWLHHFSELVARHRLKRLAAHELEWEARPVLGLLLDIAQQGTHPQRFAAITKILPAAETAEPLFEAEARTANLRARAERRASERSRRWGRWCAPLELKPDALRPAGWVLETNPEFLCRADWRGDLRASVLAALTFDQGAGKSELALARAAGGSRAQVRQALASLEWTGRVRRHGDGHRRWQPIRSVA